MSGTILALPHTPSWRGAHLKIKTQGQLHLTLPYISEMEVLMWLLNVSKVAPEETPETMLMSQAPQAADTVQWMKPFGRPEMMTFALPMLSLFCFVCERVRPNTFLRLDRGFYCSELRRTTYEMMNVRLRKPVYVEGLESHTGATVIFSWDKISTLDVPILVACSTIFYSCVVTF